MVANGSLLNIKESVDVIVAFDKIEITHKFLCLNTYLSLALLGYDFLLKNTKNILTIANCLLILNVPIITHLHKSRKNSWGYSNCKLYYWKYSENILEGQMEQQDAHLMS